MRVINNGKELGQCIDEPAGSTEGSVGPGKVPCAQACRLSTAISRKWHPGSEATSFTDRSGPLLPPCGYFTAVVHVCLFPKPAQSSRISEAKTLREKCRKEEFCVVPKSGRRAGGEWGTHAARCDDQCCHLPLRRPRALRPRGKCSPTQLPPHKWTEFLNSLVECSGNDVPQKVWFQNNQRPEIPQWVSEY